MCGIAGFVGSGSHDDLQRMNAALSHRGPDGEGYWHSDERGDAGTPVHLAHKRLAIIDIEGGAQPMWTADGRLGVTYNGEVYNHAELRAELEQLGHTFTSDHCDTEVLLHGYRQWGAELPQHLNGMWAFAIYDRDAGTLFLCRDRFGQKPLYYAKQGDTFAFGSELHAVTAHTGVATNMDALSLRKYFAYGFIPAPRTLYERVSKLPAGHSLTLRVDDLSYEVTRWWDYVLEPFDSVPADAERVWGEQLRELLGAAVRRRLMSDVPLGVFLSGGIDSSAVTAYAAGHVDSGKLRTFAIGFDDAQFDESTFAERIAKQFGTDHTTDRLSLTEARGLMREVVGRLDEPMGDSSLMPTYLLCRAARKHVTVTLGGDGGDELFAGYAPFKALRYAKWYDALTPRPVHAAIRTLAGLMPVGHGYMATDFKIKRTLRGLSHPARMWNPVWLGPLDPRELGECFDGPVDVEDVYSEAIELWDTCPQDNLVDRTTRFYVKLYLQDGILTKVDRASMLNSLEVRSPFLDRDLVDFVRRIPAAYRFRGGVTKHLLKSALAEVLPRDVLHRSKQGFAMPIGRWFKDGELSVDAARLAPGQRAGFVRGMIDDHRAGRADHRLFLWNQWVLGRWCG
ncbi:MAG: asparagine synthase (glutamine-hydrolyzing) [Phycisphaera sp.]|nr:asparagine synthase (glutamine-hydrolyzing) [Phycisphaera sp.]